MSKVFETAEEMCQFFKDSLIMSADELSVEEMALMVKLNVATIMSDQLKHTKELISELFDETINFLEDGINSYKGGW